MEEGPILPVTARPSRTELTCEFYTDGSGSRGKCTSSTPAGWRWTRKIDDGWQDAHRPVVTDPLHRDIHRGAAVGSNNTGEVTAILEALLYTRSIEAAKVIIRSDSLWAINVITGRWDAKHHKKLVGLGLACSLTTTPQLKVHFHWVKGHAGTEGNERADKLAHKGKAAQQKQGTDAALPEMTQNTTQATPDPQKWTDAMHEAAKQTFRKAKTIRARPWISGETLEALTAARQAEAEGEPSAKSKRNKAKRMAHKDKVKWVHDQLMNDPSGEAHSMWKTVRRQRMGLREKKQHLVVDQKPIPWSIKCTKLSKHTWKQSNGPLIPPLQNLSRHSVTDRP